MFKAVFSSYFCYFDWCIQVSETVFFTNCISKQAWIGAAGALIWGSVEGKAVMYGSVWSRNRIILRVLVLEWKIYTGRYRVEDAIVESLTWLRRFLAYARSACAGKGLGRIYNLAQPIKFRLWHRAHSRHGSRSANKVRVAVPSIVRVNVSLSSASLSSLIVLPQRLIRFVVCSLVSCILGWVPVMGPSWTARFLSGWLVGMWMSLTISSLSYLFESHFRW